MTASRLERAYRRVLRWYPRSWRIANGEAAVSTLLDQADAQGRTAARTLELLDLAVHGLGFRLLSALPQVPFGVRDRVAAVSVGIGAMFSLVLIVLLEYRPTSRSADDAWADVATFGPFASPMIIVYLLWLGGFVATLFGLDRTPRWLIALTLPLMAVVRAVADAHQMWLRPSATTMVFFALLALMVLAGRPLFHRAASVRVGVAAIASLVILGVANASAANRVFQDPPLFHYPLAQYVWWVPAIAIVAAIALRRARQSAWAAAALLLAVPWTALAAFGSLIVAQMVERAAMIGVTALAVAIIATALRLLGVRIHLEPVTPTR